MKIVNLSPHRSATTSFGAYCQGHGLTCQHWPGPAFDAAAAPALSHGPAFVWQMYAQLLDRADAFADVPVPFLYRELSAALPDARFVLFRRRPERWIASVRNHTRGRGLEVLERLQYREICGRDAKTLDAYSDTVLFYGYEQFIENAVQHFLRTGGKFTLLDLEQDDVSRRLNAFLGLSAGVAFPRIEHAP